MLGCFLCSELPAPSIDLAPESTVMGMVKCVLERKERVRDRPVWRPQNLSFLTWNQKTGSEPTTNGRAAESGPKVPAGPEVLSLIQQSHGREKLCVLFQGPPELTAKIKREESQQKANSFHITV